MDPESTVNQYRRSGPEEREVAVLATTIKAETTELAEKLTFAYSADSAGSEFNVVTTINEETTELAEKRMFAFLCGFSEFRV